MNVDRIVPQLTVGTSIVVFTRPWRHLPVPTFFLDHTINYWHIQWQTKILKTSQPSTPQVSASSRGLHAILITCKGYKPAAGKTVDEYHNLDANDESLARWKASLGLDSASGGDKNGPKVALCIIDSLIAFIYPSLSSRS